MKIGAALRNILLNDATISGLLGSRIAPMISGQQQQLPFCVYRIVNVNPIMLRHDPAPFDVVDVEFTVFSESYDDAHVILDQVRSVLDFYCGTAKGVKILKSNYQGSRDEFDTPGRMYAHTVFFTVRALQIVTTPQLLAGVLSATANAMCNLHVLQYLQANASVSGSTTNNLQVSKQLAGILGAYANATCGISISGLAELAGFANLLGNATLAAQIKKQMAGNATVVANATLVVAVYQAQQLAGFSTISGNAALTAKVAKYFAGAPTFSALVSCAVVIEVSYLLDTYTARAAYSLQQLKTGVTSVIRVRRSSDDTESDFTASEVTDGTLTTWVGAGNNGFIAKIYDQSGNANHAVQTTDASQFQIVASGSLNLEGTIAAFKTTATTGIDIPSGMIAASADYTIFTAARATVLDVGHLLKYQSGSSDRNFIRTRSGDFGHNVYPGGAILATNSSTEPFSNTTTPFLLTSLRDVSATQKTQAYIDGTAATENEYMSASVTSTYTIGNHELYTDGWVGNFFEMIFFDDDQSANRTAIESDINNRYGL